jgi:hypothetical protein
LGASYNARVRESLDKQEGLGAAQRWSDLRDIANEMADEAKKKAFACEVEYNLRTGIET